MTLTRRVRDLEAGAGAAGQGGGPSDAGWRGACAAFLALVPDDLREPLAARLFGPYGPDTEALADWVAGPFARWAPALPSDYILPRALVAWVLAPPRPYWFGHHCGRCGLTVPLFLVPSSMPNPPADLRAFPACLACGGVTSHAAGHRPDPPATVEEAGP